MLFEAGRNDTFVLLAPLVEGEESAIAVIGTFCTCGGPARIATSCEPFSSRYRRSTKLAISFARSRSLPLGCQADHGGSVSGFGPVRTATSAAAAPARTSARSP